MSLFLGPNDRMGRLQLNYVSVSGDEEDYNGDAVLGWLCKMWFILLIPFTNIW